MSLNHASCNRCGNCCFIENFKCENLRVDGVIGQPNASYCGKYNERYPDMPIIMVNPDGFIIEAFCAHGAPSEEGILRQMIADGQCYLEEK